MLAMMLRTPRTAPRARRALRRYLSQHVRIGGVTRPRNTAPDRPELVPINYLSRLARDTDAATLHGHLRWLLAKDQLAQDVFLVGPPGPARRRLALAFCELLGREVEVLSLSRDTSEADLKQRREIAGGTSAWADQAPVRAALARQDFAEPLSHI